MKAILEDLAKQVGSTLKEIFNDEHAKVYQEMVTSIGSGLYYLDSDLGRGFDLKFSKSAFVVVVDIDEELGLVQAT